jgi:hypothetical protein
MPDWLIWVIIAIVVVAIIAALVVAANKKKKERDRSRAGEIREQASTQAATVQQREAHARETEAQAAQARAEADRKQAEADRLEAEARERADKAGAHRQEHEENLRRADELDPDVNTKSDDYAGPGTTRAQAGGEGRTHEHVGENNDQTTVTHPDGSTETVADRGTTGQHAEGTESTQTMEPGPNGGSHRA